ncbi:hypothetical protein C9374_004743 [Naegleria lovaniensis]|uniref:Autophagy protein 5 n=1 Tax=Naegleria lovaniensis TaxID=51637 RepID=A0AA88KNN1_NAELO|nr:uncharacterized protein C9374_004743 [Naegleria lovaniensis]KAG2382776.1 hypothetical protein C9374_004743 [Naegleria lovaniensis]
MSNTSTATQASTDDALMRKQLWEGAIPTVINIHSDQIASFQQPFPYYVMIPRQSYLSLLIERVKSHFSDFVSGFDSDQLWFSFNSIPMQWHVPAGVLYDLMGILDPDSLKLPWTLVANFGGNFPSDTVVRCNSEEDAQWNHLNNIKECMYIRFNSTSAMMTLSNEDQKELWQTVKTQNEPSFTKLLEKIKQGSKISSVEEMVYAIRVYTPIKKQGSSHKEGSSDSTHNGQHDHKKGEHALKYKKNMICVKREAAKTLTLQGFLDQHVIPRLKKIGYFGEQQETTIFSIERAVVQGVEPHRETELLWLIENCAHPDGFLYMCCK